MNAMDKSKFLLKKKKCSLGTLSDNIQFFKKKHVHNEHFTLFLSNLSTKNV